MLRRRCDAANEYAAYAAQCIIGVRSSDSEASRKQWSIKLPCSTTWLPIFVRSFAEAHEIILHHHSVCHKYWCTLSVVSMICRQLAASRRVILRVDGFAFFPFHYSGIYFLPKSIGHRFQTSNEINYKKDDIRRATKSYQSTNHLLDSFNLSV